MKALRSYLDKAATGTEAEIAGQKKLFDADNLPAATGQTDKDEFKKLLGDVGTVLPWNPNDTAPTRSAIGLVRDQRQTIEGLKGEVKKMQGALAREKNERKEADESLEKERLAHKAALDKAKNDALADRKTDLTEIASKGELLRKESETTATNRNKLDQAEKELAKLQRDNKRIQTQLANTTKENRDLKERLEESTTRLAALYEKTGQDPRSVEDAVLDARATQLIKDWKNTWQIAAMDRTGNLPYINLGSADGLTPQTTFSIHSVGLDGRLNPIPKGSLEVVRISGSNLAQARITSVKDPKRDPIIKGDRLFNPTWDPNRRKHVAIAGLADLGGEGSDNTEDLRRLLNRQNVDVDAFIDLKDEKGPKITGKGISINTDYLILADNLDNVNHPKARDKDFAAKFDKLVRDLKAEAQSNGVTVISLKKYLELIGYQPPKILRSGPVSGFGS